MFVRCVGTLHLKGVHFNVLGLQLLKILLRKLCIESVLG
jgi:hypothetical protein